jgi:choline-sulfatase
MARGGFEHDQSPKWQASEVRGHKWNLYTASGFDAFTAGILALYHRDAVSKGSDIVGKPNILLLMADQMAPAALPFYGGATAVTPVMSRLAAEGVVFSSAYCASPLCGPSRISLLSGQLPSRIGAFDNACEFRADTPTFAHYLRLGGYRTISAGKMHFVGPDQLHGFEERLTTDIYPADFSWTPDWTRPEERPTWYHSMTSVTTAGPCVRTNQIDFDEEVVFTARRKLFDIARASDPRPFFLMVSLTHPHDPFVIPKPYWDLYEGKPIPPPRVRVPRERLDPHSRRLRHVIGMDLEEVTDSQVLAARRAYYAAISYVDEQFGLILETLVEAGLDRNTVIVLCGDHGEMLGERGLWYKMTFFEGGARVPLVIRAPPVFRPRVVSESVSNIDLLPTLLDLAGLEPGDAAPLDGRSLVPLARGEGATAERTVYAEYMGEGAVSPVIMIRRGPLKFIHAPGDPDQLYDLAADPDELVNLAADPRWRATTELFLAEIRKGWNLDRIEREVLASQRRRRLVAAANAIGVLESWDYQPRRDASSEYVRSHLDLEAIEAAARFPPV